VSAIAMLDRIERYKRRGQVAASILMLAIGVGFFATGVVALRVVGIVFAVLGVMTFFLVGRSEAVRAATVRTMLRDDPDGIVWVYFTPRVPNHTHQHWVVFHCRNGHVYSAIAKNAEALAWVAELRQRCPETLFTEGPPTPELREAWRVNPAKAPRVA
jgi:hypothetical protein